MKNLLSILFLMVSVTLNSQTSKEYLENINRNYTELKAVQLDLKYSLYKGYNNKNVIESFNGIYAKNENLIYRKVNNTEYLNFKDISIKINHQEQILVLSNPVSPEIFEFDIEATLKVSSNITVVKNKNKTTDVTLHIKEFNDIPYNFIKINISKNYWINKVTFYYAYKQNFGTFNNQDLDFPRLEVEYYNVKTNAKIISKNKRENYVEIKNDVITPSMKYKAYEIIDMRKK